MSNYINPPLRAVHLKLFPTLSSLDDAIAYAQSVVPAEHWNVVHKAICTYHNTLLQEIQNGKDGPIFH